MTTKEWGSLKGGDKVLVYNGPYTQHGIVDKKWRDEKGMRWVQYHWFLRGVFQSWASKRYLSVYLHAEEALNEPEKD